MSVASLSFTRRHKCSKDVVLKVFFFAVKGNKILSNATTFMLKLFDLNLKPQVTENLCCLVSPLFGEPLWKWRPHQCQLRREVQGLGRVVSVTVGIFSGPRQGDVIPPYTYSDDIITIMLP